MFPSQQIKHTPYNVTSSQILNTFAFKFLYPNYLNSIPFSIPFYTHQRKHNSTNLSIKMDKNESATLSKSDETKKSKNLPPLIQDASPQVNRQNKKNVMNPAEVKAKWQQVIKVSTTSSVLKKQRKFILDEYDQKAIVLCQFCGGQTCPQEDFKRNKIQPNAIEGLHSNWINENILATQRPSNRLIKQYNLLQTFEKYNINSILNLQQPGEHPYCGDGIDPMVGFSYDPQLFFNKNIRFENQYWEDMTSTTFQQMMKIMNIFYRSIIKKRGKIAVHCHAGRGRTLMAICAWLIYNDRMTAQQTIDLATLKREGVLTKTSQRDFLKDFQKQVHKRWKSYALNIEDMQVKTFSEFVNWQNGGMLTSNKRKMNETPFVHGSILQILRNRMQEQSKEIIFSFIDLNDKTVFGDRKWDQKHQHRLALLKTYLDRNKLDYIKENEQVRILVTLLQDFYDSLPFTPISLHAVDKLKEELQMEREIFKNVGSKRQVKNQTLNNKVLKRWEDILKERQSLTSRVDEGSKLKEGSYVQQGQIEITSRVQQIPQQPKPNEINQQTLQNKLPLQNSAESLTDNNRLTQQSFPINNSSSDIQINSLYLNVLTEPSIVHEVGLNSLCTFIDFVKFALELMNCYRTSYPKETEEHFTFIEKCLLAKFSLLLQSKKRYFPVLFRGTNLRESLLHKKIQKLDKYLNHNIKYMAESFMKNLIEELQLFLKDYFSEKFSKLIFKIQKVNANVLHFSNSHSASGGKFFSARDAKKVYDSARI